ncbi:MULTISPECIES: hypothetical protein [Mesorhizobium]|uniref:hypothetical protein n=1 Tax=Mesorhizobium TaxID=68287 RepID=UPI001FDA55DE|nr:MULTISPECIES: hypothetical protein [Mesorhizobium]
MSSDMLSMAPPTAARRCAGVVRAFLRYLHLKGFISVALADCVPSIRRWRLAGLPTFLPPQKVQVFSMPAIGPPQRGFATMRF